MDDTASISSIPAAPDYAGRKLTVMGLGRFGGGAGVVRFLAQHGALVTLTDLKTADELAEPLEDIRDIPLASLRLGEHREDDFTSADLVVASPAVRPDHPCLEAARRRGIPVTTEVGLFLRHCPSKVVGVTGTAGKSTTAALIHHLLTAGGAHAWLGGNIGGSLLGDLPHIRPTDWVVLELSSFQLSYLDADGRSPDVSVVTNFAPNHLDWHQSLAEYRTAKQTILRHQQPGDVAVLPDEGDAHSWPSPGHRIEFGRQPSCEGVRISSERMEIRIGEVELDVPWGAIPIGLGDHSRLNTVAAVAAALSAHANPRSLEGSLATFRPLPHRLEFLGTFRGRHFYNDSKATTPEAAMAALRSFNAPVIVMAGGSDKGIDLAAFAAELANRAKAAALMGAAAPGIDRLITAASGSAISPPRCIADDFSSAFDWAVSQSSEGDIILLSPGCASFGWFRDYAERGNAFGQAATALQR